MVKLNLEEGATLIMNFVSFAAEYGLVIDHLIFGKWVRCTTSDHPTKKNGSYKLEGTIGWVQNFSCMDKPVTWRDKNAKPISRDEAMRTMKRLDTERKERNQKAAKKAGWIMHNAKCDHHPYLAAKGFPKEKGWVWEGKLVIPMRIGGELVGCQLIDENGEKKFLYGQQTKNARAEINAKGRAILVEGYGTGLAVRAALRHAKLRYNIVVCFSAGNLVDVARDYPDCVVVADNDKSGTGERAAKKTGRPYWISPIVGEDAVDYLTRVGIEEAALVFSALLG
jgi:putative DNA primase/helicase